jgi:prepilin-type N-terminal cleavage/methylation domain-containing protein
MSGIAVCGFNKKFHQTSKKYRTILPHRVMEGSMQKTQSGFTLVEIAIVLVIIGLLLGGVLKGQELVNGAKVKNLANDFRSISSFVYAYQDRFRALPGDDRSADTHVGGTRATSGNPGNARIDGAWDSDAPTSESYLFWQHVRLAGLATGTTDIASPDYIPLNVEGGRLGITGNPVLNDQTRPYPASFYVCSQGIQGRHARQIDTTIDDGNTTTGSVRVVNNGSTVDVKVQNDAALYTVCMAF